MITAGGTWGRSFLNVSSRPPSLSLTEATGCKTQQVVHFYFPVERAELNLNALEKINNADVGQTAGSEHDAGMQVNKVSSVDRRKHRRLKVLTLN